jgi:hypothetical protein
MEQNTDSLVTTDSKKQKMGTRSSGTQAQFLQDDAPFNIYLRKTMEGSVGVIRRQIMRFGGLEKIPYGRAHLSPHDLVSMDHFFGMTELHKSFNRLLQIRALTSIPPRFLTSGRSEHLKFILEIHLQELYILRHRLRSHTLFVDRSILRPKGKAKGDIKALLKKIDLVMGQRTRDRNWHVHRARYEQPEVSRPSVFDVLSLAEGGGGLPGEPKWKPFAAAAYREGRDRLRTRIEGELVIVSAFLNEWARTLDQMLDE